MARSRSKISFVRRHPKLVAVIAVVIVVLIAAAVLLYFLRPDLFSKLFDPGDDAGGGYSEEVPAGQLADITSAGLSVHFIAPENSAAGDCTLIKAGDTEVLIDAGSQQSSAATIKQYLDDYCTDGVLEYVIATHADSDHISGLVGRSSGGSYDGILYSYSIGTIITFDRSDKELTTKAGNPTLYSRFLDAVEYAGANGAEVHTALECWNGTNGAQRSYILDDETGKISMNILYNYYYEHSSPDENNYSVCMLLSHEIAEDRTNHYLFTGDLEKEGEEYLVRYNQLPQVELFKAGHHGSPTSSNDCLLSVIRPKAVVVCCCAGTDEYTKDPDNQFPSQAFVDRVCAYTQNVYCTNVVSENEDGYQPMNGDIVFYSDDSGSDGAGIKLWCSNNTLKLKDTDWFKACRTCPAWGWTAADREAFVSSSGG